MPKIISDLKQNMLAEVEKRLLQGGYSAVTIRSVALGCGVGVGTVYNYFPSKEAMLAEYLLSDWHQCIASIAAVRGSAQDVARCICEELLRFAGRHTAIFLDEDARGSFVGSFSQYHSLLRSQLSQPLVPFCPSPFAAEFMAEALLTWTMAGKAFEEIWPLLQGAVENEE